MLLKSRSMTKLLLMETNMDGKSFHYNGQIFKMFPTVSDGVTMIVILWQISRVSMMEWF